MSIDIKSRTLGMVATNAYLVGDTTTKRAILIDPVDDADALLQMAADSGYEIALILATHAHFDHVLASRALVEKTGAPFYIHQEAAPYLAKLPSTGVMFTGQRFPDAAEPDRLLADDEVITLDSIVLKSLYTPGHAPGHLSFYLESEQVVFSGDALFAGSIGRTDLEGGDLNLLLDSIRTQLLTLEDDVRALPGHMGPTTIGRERQTNPYLLRG
jgi:hydroxyacylglutathione hydrolase